MKWREVKRKTETETETETERESCVQESVEILQWASLVGSNGFERPSANNIPVLMPKSNIVFPPGHTSNRIMKRVDRIESRRDHATVKSKRKMHDCTGLQYCSYSLPIKLFHISLWTKLTPIRVSTLRWACNTNEGGDHAWTLTLSSSSYSLRLYLSLSLSFRTRMSAACI